MSLDFDASLRAVAVAWADFEGWIKAFGQCRCCLRPFDKKKTTLNIAMITNF
jgi:hypothetical protein